MKKNKNILVVAAHPDDEVLGCGGTLASLSKKGFNIYTLFVSDGVSARNETKDIIRRKIEQRKLAAIKVSKILGCKIPEFLLYPDNRLDQVPLLDIIKKIEEKIRKIKPETIFTHFDSDLNIDHKLVNKAVITATRPVKNFPVKKIILFEVLSSTEWRFSKKENFFQPNFFVDIDKSFRKKILAAKAYKSEIKAWPHPRSLQGIKNLAKFRGQTVGKNLAEAFVIARLIK